MSSFVVDKKELVKAGGLVAGIMDGVRDKDRFYLWLQRKNKYAEPEDMYDLFVKVYEINAASVQQQYGDKEPEHDENKYTGIFAAYRKAGKRLYWGTREQRADMFFELRMFFHSVIYQLDVPKYEEEVKRFFYSIIDKMMGLLDDVHRESWGEIEIVATEEVKA